MLDTDEVMGILKKQLDEWDAEGILEEKLIEHGFKVMDYNPANTTEESDTD